MFSIRAIRVKTKVAFCARFARNNAAINLFTGAIIGFLLCCQFRSIRFQLKSTALCAFDQLSTNDGTDSDHKYSTLAETIGKVKTHSRSNLLLVGVLTAQKYLDSRALSIHKTWGPTVPGNLLFFSSSSSKSEYGLPLIALPTVDDSYPPQKKSFLMLKFINDHFIDHFEWFFRADDDVYVDTERLELFLRSLNSSKPLFIGQPGVGNKDEFGLLNLAPEDNFCMGGPGIIMSRATLKKLSPHIKYCLKHLYSTHEDVEIGRCVRKFVDITCTWAFDMNSIFFHNFSGEISLNTPIKAKVLSTAITYHPLKSESSMLNFHYFYLQHKHLKLRKKISALYKTIAEMQLLLDHDENEKGEESFYISNMGDLIKGSHTLFPHQDQCINRSDVLTWTFIDRYLYSDSNVNPKRRVDGHIKTALDNNIADIISSINELSKQKGRYVEFKNFYYGYLKIDPLKGVQYILDLYLMYRKYLGKRISIPVRRHAYAVQNYAKVETREVPITTKNQIVNVIVPLSGRLQPFKRFIDNFLYIYAEDPFLTLAIVLFPDANESQFELQETKRIINKLTEAGIPLKFAQLGGHFARAAGLQRGSSLFEKDDLLFFVDVDMHLQSELFQNVRLNTIKGKQVYYPIVFSQYNPRFSSLSSRDKISIDTISGYWRQYGFGIVSLFNVDLQAVGGFNVAIQGWGQEDVDLYIKFVHSNITIFRAPDENLIHIYHDIKCNPLLLSTSQYEMCLGTKFASLGSVEDLYKRAKQQLL
ncbi:chondroitin sulfate synthase 1-like protein [Dinothrombium tinctorium]|uniref:Hexosyltransferase n=1 Tax=Dinothrombium tinctorium TaxID=1965070 RepID=A0A3S3S902_9ACAR|nr:chondroitin sulfate synthase 1-like protein [Dinothrombium tinctorium]